jgi:hypothetical protein
MLEWGDVPTHLETLTSENEVDGGIERTTITVLPEVGCGIDNLETTKKIEVFKAYESVCQLYSEKDYQIATVDRSKLPHILDLETIFEASNEVVTENNGNIIQYPRRIRLSFSIDTSTSLLTSDISMQVERQISDQSTKGNKWTGEASNSGGLDARTVVSHIGKDIVYGDIFAVKKEKQNQDRWDFDYSALNETWAHVMNENVFFNQKDNHDGVSGITSVRLPQNILIRYGCALTLPDGGSTNQWGVEVSQFVSCNNKIQRKVALRLFDETKTSRGNQCCTHFWVA